MLLDLKLVIRLQEIDHRLTELTREIAALPVHIAQIEKKLTSHQRKLDADRAALTANQKERKKCESDIQSEDQKISRLKDQMLGAKTNEQYRAFQNEIDFAQKNIRKAEDRILELMSESEPLDQAVKAAEASLKTEKDHVEAEKQQARDRTAFTQKSAQELQTERSGIVKQITPVIYQRYERVRKSRRGIAVAEAVEGRCSACNMAMRLQFLQDLKKGDQIMSCESCTRILYYTPPVPVEDPAGDEAAALH
jgi:uncharacterized protein